jgi:PAS domain S-box-containing protein
MTESNSTKRADASLELLYTISRELAAQIDLPELLKRILQLTAETMGAASGGILVLDEGEDITEGALIVGGKVLDHTAAQQADTVKSGLAGWVLQERQPALVTNTHNDPRWMRRDTSKLDEVARSAICVPLQTRDRVVGVLTLVHSQFDHYGEADLALLEAIAVHAATGVANAQLFAETQAASRLYAGLFDDSIDPILITDNSGEITDANVRAEDFLGYKRDELSQRSMMSLHTSLPPELPDDLTSLDTGETIPYTSALINAKGAELPVEVHVKRIDVARQPFLQWIVHDISERLELDQLRDDLTSMIFHDLRSPLANVISSLEVLQAAMPSEGEMVQSVLGIALRSSRRLSRLVDSLLDVSRLEAGKDVLDRTESSLRALIEEAVEEVQPVAEAKEHSLSLNLPKKLPDMMFDVDMIRRVLINLLENAIRYTPAGGQITVTARHKGSEVTVDIQDTGPGIPPDEHKRIFEKFMRARHEERIKGLGLGLSFCRLAVEAHAGRIWVDSEPGKGSTFSFTLPV